MIPVDVEEGTGQHSVPTCQSEQAKVPWLWVLHMTGTRRDITNQKSVCQSLTLENL